MKKMLAFLLVAAMLASSVLAGCSSTPANSSAATDSSAAAESSTPADDSTSDDSTDDGLTGEAGVYTYTDAVSQLATNWNPHTYQTTDDAYPSETGGIRVGLYGFVFNDELHAVEGKEAYSGYKIIPEMAASEPVDVTEQVKADHPEFNIPESVTAGYAYTIDLNPKAVWEDGTPINADTYVYSMQRLLDPDLINYRASDYYSGDMVIAGAENYANQGKTTPVSVATMMEREGIATVEEFLEKYGDTPAYINWNYSFGAAYDFENNPFDGSTINSEALSLDAADETVETPLTLNEMWTFYPLCYGDDADSIATGQSYFPGEVYYGFAYADGVDFSTVGCYKTGDYQITLVFGKSLTGFDLLYSLSSNWIVNEDLYESCLKQNGDVWTSTYNTSVETTLSYGPYKMTEYQSGKSMRFERNETWYGYTDGQHQYVDPADGQTYDMYMTDVIDTQVVAESSTQKMMFLKGELMTYGLGSDDFATYRNSEYAHSVEAETIFFLILNGYKSALDSREQSDGFDTTTTDIQTLSLKTFRQAVAVTYDKEQFAATVSPARSGAYGLIGNLYIYDPDTGARYRSSDAAKEVLCDFYSVDTASFANLDEAVSSITGYDPEVAKELYNQAFDEAIAAGFITDADGDGISDQTVTIEYALSADSDFMTQTIDYLNEKMSEVTVGTPFEGKIKFVKSAPYGNDWSNKIRQGLADTVLAGWQGSRMNPFGLTDLNTNPSKQYDANWFDATATDLTFNVNGTDVTLNLKQWSDALNGTTVTSNGVEYNFGNGVADQELRLDILAAIEGAVLQTYDYIPMLQNASVQLLSQKAYYVVEEFNPVLSFGGIEYLKYNYDDAEWAAYVASQGGELTY